MTMPKEKNAVSQVAPKSRNGGTRASARNRETIPKDQHEKLLNAFLRLWLVTKPNSISLDSVRNETAIAKLLASEFPRYNKADGSGSRLVQQPEIAAIRKMALKAIGVKILFGDQRDSIIGSFSDRTRRFEEKFGLEKRLFVPPPHAGVPSNIHLLYREAARAFKDLIESDKENPVVSIGGGKTIFQMLYYLEHIDRPFEIRALNSATRMADTEVFDSCYLAHAAHRLCHRSTVHVTSLPPLHENSPKEALGWHKLLWKKNRDIANQFRKSLNPDIVFVGTGGFSEGSPSISRFYEKVGISYKDLKAFEPIGDVNLCFFDRDGRDLTGDIVDSRWKGVDRVSYFDKMPECHPFLLGLSISRLQTLVREGKTVVLVAGGDRRKTQAIEALLNAKVVNALVTDEDTMNQILYPEIFGAAVR